MGGPRRDDAGAAGYDLRQRRRSAASFGSTSLKTNGKIFAMLVKDRLVLKLDRRRVDALVAAVDGERFDPGHGRVMKEWIALDSTSDEVWLALATEAEAFVGGRSRES